MSLGIDIVQIERIKKAMQSDKFAHKILSPAEIDAGTQKNIMHTAASFAAKEAFSKALGTGFRGFNFDDISVMHDELGKPYFVFSDKVRKIAQKKGIENIELSISHENDYAVAVAAASIDKNYKNYTKAISKFENESCSNAITPQMIQKLVPKREKNIHKGNCGRLFVIAGSKGLTGAAIMSTRAALKSGAGLISLGCAQSLNSIFEIATPEVMTVPLADRDGIITFDDIDKIIKKANESDCVLVGPGLCNNNDIQCIVKTLVTQCQKPIVIDADGINAICANIDVLSEHKSEIIITPHIGEFARLVKKDTSDILSNTEQYASEFADKYNITVVLKSHRTVVAYGGKVFVNILGNPGMATGGSGDVLAGTISSFKAQGLNCADAATAGVYIHSLAADMACFDKGTFGLTPSDIIEALPYAIKYI